MEASPSQGRHGDGTGALTTGAPQPAPDHDADFMEGALSASNRDLEGLFYSALRASDKELASVILEVDEITSVLSQDVVDPQALRIAVRPAVWSAIRHVIVASELRYLLLTDDLTGLYNRRGFFAVATQQLKLASRNDQSMLLLFCDIDNLKHINDTFGHREGDLALARTGKALQETFRDSDILARLGGDEFAVVAPAASSQHEALVLRRLKKALRKANPSTSAYELSLSVGAARFDPQHAVALGDLMERADKDMYERKRKRPKLL
jgi:diguanylate cyclase (GGDEF)-like protein